MEQETKTEETNFLDWDPDGSKMKEAFEAYDRYFKDRAWKNFFSFKMHIDDDLKERSFIVRWFVWLKVAFCLLFNLTSGSATDAYDICVTSFDSSRGPEGEYNWTAIWVDTRLFYGWSICIGTDGT